MFSFYFVKAKQMFKDLEDDNFSSIDYYKNSGKQITKKFELTFLEMNSADHLVAYYFI